MAKNESKNRKTKKSAKVELSKLVLKQGRLKTKFFHSKIRTLEFTNFK